MQIMKNFGVSLVALACVAAPVPAYAKPKGNKPTPPSVTQVVVYLKDELRRFNERPDRSPRVDRALPCGANISLDISRFDVEIATTTTVDAEGNISVEVPIGSTKLGGEFGKGKGTEYSSTLNMSFDPLSTTGAGGADPVKLLVVPATDKTTEQRLFEPGAVANTLISLEKSLREAGAHSPCFALTSPDDADQAVTMGFTITKSKKSGFSFSFLIFSIGASKSKEREVANTITANFKPATGGGVLVPVKVHEDQ